MLKIPLLLLTLLFTVNISSAWTLSEIEKLQINLYQSEVNGEDVDNMIAILKQQYASNNNVPLPKLDADFFSTYGDDITTIEQFRSEIATILEKVVKENLNLVNIKAVYSAIENQIPPNTSTLGDIKEDITKKITDSYSIKVSQIEIEREIRHIISFYEDEDAVRKHIQSNKEMMNKIQTKLLHVKVTAFMSQTADITYINIGIPELDEITPESEYDLGL